MLRLTGHRVYRGMKVADCFTALKMSGRWTYIANFDNCLWFRLRDYADSVVEITYNKSGVVVDVDIV